MKTLLFQLFSGMLNVVVWHLFGSTEQNSHTRHEVITNLIEILPAVFSLKYESKGADTKSSAFLSNKFAKIAQ